MLEKESEVAAPTSEPVRTRLHPHARRTSRTYTSDGRERALQGKKSFTKFVISDDVICPLLPNFRATGSRGGMPLIDRQFHSC